jgi:peroxiredoxin
MSTNPALEVGTVAPDFALRNQFGEDVTLSALRGSKVVVMFYPFAFTGICTGELCEIRDRRAEFDADDAVVLSISCDAPPTLKAFAEAEGLTHTLLSDFWPHGEVARAYGAFWEQTGFATRATYVLDRDGVIRWSVVNGPGEARSTDDYTHALAAID